MGTFGLRLRGEREKRGLRLVDVAKATKVGVHHLAALEHEDFDNLPDDEIVTGFVRTYAEHLGLDPDTVVTDFARELEAVRPATAPDGEEQEQEEVEPAPITAAEEQEKETAPDEAAVPGEETPPEDEFVPGEEVTPVETIVPGAGRPRSGAWPVAIAGGSIVVLILLIWWWIGGGDAQDPRLPRTEPDASAPVAEQAAPEPLAAEPAAEVQAEPVETVPTQAPPSPDTERRPPPARLSIPEYGVGTRVVNRRLVGTGDRFPEGTRVWFWTLVQGGSSGDTIRHVWIHDGRETHDIPLEIGGWHWRTHTRKYLSPGSAGHWAVEARDAAGRLLARSEFECFAPETD
jgi:transcriptional regulator with XRE-family HTH domain